MFRSTYDTPFPFTLPSPPPSLSLLLLFPLLLLLLVLLSSYTRMWVQAHGALEDLLVDEHPPTAPRPLKDRLQVFQVLATFYLKYLQIFRSLEAVYDQIVHPQKRRMVRHVLDGVMGRILELKNEMVELEFSEFHYFDDVLQDLKLTPVSQWYCTGD